MKKLLLSSLMGPAIVVRLKEYIEYLLHPKLRTGINIVTPVCQDFNRAFSARNWCDLGIKVNQLVA